MAFERRSTRVTAVVAVLAASVTSCAPRTDAPAAHLVERARVAMGSELRLSAWTDQDTTVTTAFEAAFAEFDRLESLMSVWREGSDVVRLNAAAGQHAVPVSVETREVLRAAHDVSEWTGGRFDVTFGALSDLWKFDHDQDNVVPSPAAVRARLPLIDYRTVQVNEAAGTAFIARAGARIHLGGIGKGYAVQRVVALFRARGIRDFMIQSGGDLYVAGTKGGKPWRLGVADPRRPEDSFATIELRDETLSTSGDYERFFFSNGRRYHHILDPMTGQPAMRCRSVTVVSDSPLLSDGLSTGVFILGPIEGMKLIERLDKVDAIIVSAANEVLVSSGLKNRVTIVRPPTDAP